MNEIRILLEKNWVCKDTDKELYYKVKKDIPLFQQFVREQLGWKLIHTEHILKLEKIPSHAEAFMGIQDFSDTGDYCILCVVLMYLEDKEEQEQFLLSELIDYVETQLKSCMEIDWTSFAQRKSLVRVLQYMERLCMLRVYEGSSEAFGRERGQEVLYENTGYSKYFATTFSTDISQFSSWRDFEAASAGEISADRGHIRINRVYRQLVTAPAMYWDSNEDPDSLYLKNQRQWVARNLREMLGGRLDIHRSMACWMAEEQDSFGILHPRQAMLAEIVLLVCKEIQSRRRQHQIGKEENEYILLEKDELEELILECRRRWSAGWSKEYRQMQDERLVSTVTGYMKLWMLLRESGGGFCILPGAGKTGGYYPADFRGEADE